MGEPSPQLIVYCFPAVDAILKFFMEFPFQAMVMVSFADKENEVVKKNITNIEIVIFCMAKIKLENIGAEIIIFLHNNS